MRAFLLACLGVVALAVAAYGLLEGLLGRNAGTAFAVKGSTRVSDADKPDPRGFLTSVHEPAGGVSSGRSQTGGPPPQTRQVDDATRGKPAAGAVTDDVKK